MRPWNADELPRSMRDLVNDELNADETLVRAAQPSPVYLAVRSVPVAIFGLFFGGFALFWINAAYTGTSHIPAGGDGMPGAFRFFPLFGIPFLLVGAAMVLSPIYAYVKALSTVYAVTDKRAIIISNAVTRSVNSYYASDFTDIGRSGELNGYGDVIFARRFGVDNRGNRTNSVVGFLGAPEPQEFERLIRDLKAGAQTLR
jgi:hypothetical protein